MLDYTIIAGPNGAGKSTYSYILSSLDSLIFDADIVKAAKQKQYPDIPGESIEIMLTTAYWEMEDVAIQEKRDLTVETNLRDDFLINRAAFFKNKGYSINLIYMLLPNIETSVDRVSLRVAQNGHFIDLDSIKYNFEKGLVMLKTHCSKFDNVRILNTSLSNDLSIPKNLLILKNNRINYIDADAPYWAKPILDELVQKIKTN